MDLAFHARQDTLALISAWLKDVGVEAIINPVDPSSIFADYNESTADTPCVLSHGNFDLAEHATSSSIDPLGNYFSYHSSQFNPIGVNNASVNDPGVDAAMDRVKNSVDFAEIKDAMVMAFPPPSVEGVGSVGGFSLQLEDRSLQATLPQLAAATRSVLEKTATAPEIAGAFSSFTADDPQLRDAAERRSRLPGSGNGAGIPAHDSAGTRARCG